MGAAYKARDKEFMLYTSIKNKKNVTINDMRSGK